MSKNAGDTNNSEAISLEDLDKILVEDSPEFAASLGDLSEKIEAADTDIESINIDDDNLGADSDFDGPPSRLDRFPRLKNLLSPLRKLFQKSSQARMSIKSKLLLYYRRSLVFIQTQPIEFAKYLFSLTKIILKKIQSVVASFKALPLWKKSSLILIIGLLGLAGYLAQLNVRGAWLPMLFEEPLTSLSTVADSSWKVTDGEGVIGLYQAFPQKEHRFQFRKTVVNLKIRPGSRLNPMGFFEFYVDVDSEQTAVEMSTRHSDFHDRIQRVVESFTYPELESETGKLRMKLAIQKELNSALTQGWVNEVFIKTILLKP